MATIALAGCTDAVRIGDRCEYSSECPAPYRCAQGRCRAECRVNVDCPLGALCVLGDDGVGSCSLEDDPDCASSGECGDGLLCVAARCVDGCTTDAECASGNECWSAPELGASFCVDPRQRPDGGAPIESDAGTDGGTILPDAYVLDAHVPRDAGQPCAGATCDLVADVALAQRHACALTRGGAVWCWGSDESGEASGSDVGADDCAGIACRTRPTRIALSGGAMAVELALGNGFACARIEDGTVQCWGSNASGQLGRADLTPRALPVEGVSSATTVVAGESSVLAIARTPDTTSVALVGWGDNRQHELRAAPRFTRATIVSDAPDAIAMGGYFACAIRGGAVGCWGANGLGQLGRSGASSPEEAPVDGLAATATRIVAAAARTCAIDAAGALSCWGLDDAPPLALAPHEPMHELWASPTGPVFCGLAGDARAPVCFGRPEADSAFWPEGGSEPRAAPSPIHRSPLPTDVRKIANDAGTACVVSESGELWCWGANDRGQLGQGRSGGAETLPVRVVIPAG